MTKSERRPRATVLPDAAGDPFGRDAGASRVDWSTLAMIVVLVLVAIVRARLLAVPFERDEGEYAYMGRLILDGGLPYRDAYNMKLPGTYAMYALIMAAFGGSPAGVHAGLAIVSLATAVLFYFAFRRLFSATVGLAAGSLYICMAVSPAVLGMAAHATHFVNLFVALGCWVCSRWDDRRWFVSSALAGLTFGMAVLMKQPAGFLAAFGALVVADRARASGSSWRRPAEAVGVYVAAAATPYAAVVLVMLATGAFDRFWFWTVGYASSYAAASTPWELLTALFGFSFRPIFAEYRLAWVLAAFGLAAIWLPGVRLRRGLRRTGDASAEAVAARQRVFATGFALASAAAVLPGLNFRQHYFVVALPAVGLLAALALERASGLVRGRTMQSATRALPFAATVAMALAAVLGDPGYYLRDPPDDVCRRIYAGNPFVEAREIGGRIAADTAPGDTVAIVGSEPEILVYANRRSATGYLYVYPLVEPQPDNVRMQREMMAEIEAARPKYLVYCNVQASWAARPDSPTDILAWFNRYAASNYEVAGVVELPADGRPAGYYWNADARARGARPNAVWLLRRRSTS
jgi:4-amino-4-deoxy-L-arabinose transferase-like glycosyltransferase